MNDLRIPPQDILAEQAVLGSIFISPEKIVTVSEYLTPVDFFRPSHQILFKAMLEIYERGEAIDAVTIKGYLESQGSLSGVGGLPYIAEVVNSTPTSQHVEGYAKIVASKSKARTVIAELTDAIQSAYDDALSIDDVIAKTEQTLVSVNNSKSKGSFQPISQVILGNFDTIEERASRSSDVTGLPTGFRDLDKATTGLHKGNLIVLAARPAMGKTAFALNIAQNVATQSDLPVAVFSLEMRAEALVERMLAAEGPVKSQSIRTGQLSRDEWERLVYAQGQLYNAPIYIHDTPGIKISEIRSQCRKLASDVGGLGLIVIDYLQLIKGSRSENRQQEVSDISRQLKVIAMELNVPVIALSQLSRGVEQRQNKRPMLSDLRESGSIEQDADIVAFLHRESYYTKHEQGQPENNITELILEKNRHGKLTTIQLYFHKEYVKFSDVEERK
ncbi:TPA: replicative DNA helicase [Streptococcus suis]|nr:replicative DNA helicase [Streptococcus suis]